MEYVEGETLYQILRREGTLELRRTAEIMRQVVAAIEAAHNEGILHRNLKPSNILIARRRGKDAVSETGNELVKVSEFSLSRILADDSEADAQDRSELHRIVGAPEYMAPEQLESGVHLDARADIYSLAAITYQMLGGKPPFTGDILQITAQKLSQPPPPLRSLRSDIPADVEKALMHGLVREMESRPASANEWFQPLEEAIADHPSRYWTDESRLVILGPSGAEVYIDDERHGSIERSDRMIIGGVPPGKHVLRISHAEAGEDERVIEVVANGPEQIIHAQLESVATKKHDDPQVESGELVSGKVLHNRYEIVRRIGGGKMSALYLAKDRNLVDAPCVIKEIIESDVDETRHQEAIAEFKRESDLLATLNHPSIPTLLDYFYDETSRRFYRVMQFSPGDDLASLLRNSSGGRVDEITVTHLGIQVADVLYYLHTRPEPIIHRNLKPSALVLDRKDNRVMLRDFGIAQWAYKRENAATVGTVGYAPPELFTGQVDARSDIYSLGATMFQLLTGSDPQDNPILVFDFTKSPRPRQINPALSSEMEQIVTRAVEYKPEKRFQSGAELHAALKAHLEKLRLGQVSYEVPIEPPGGKHVAAPTVFCGFCGGRISADDIFCAHCGSRQPVLATDLTGYWFYFSHAKGDDDDSLRQFYHDLDGAVRQATGITLTSFGFFNADTADEWNSVRLNALQSSRILVSVYSPNYFASETCGKEWQVFRSRLESATAMALSESVGTVALPPPVILPVLWSRADELPPLPNAVKHIQYLDVSGSSGELYSNLGLRSLILRTEYRGQYEEFVTKLAATLVETAKMHELPRGAATVSMADVSNAFTETPRHKAQARVDNLIDSLDSYEQQLLAHALPYLLTSSGTKIFQEVDNLVRLVALPDKSAQREFRALIDKLRSKEFGILEETQTRGLLRGKRRVEISDDLLAAPLLAWRERYLQEKGEPIAAPASGPQEPKPTRKTVRSSLKYSCYISYRSGSGNNDLMYSFIDNLHESLSDELSVLNRYEVFLDRKLIVGGSRLGDEITRALSQSACMIMVYTPIYFDPSHSYSAREYKAMEDLEKARLSLLAAPRQVSGLIIPIVLRGMSQLPDEIRSRRQVTDFSEFVIGSSKFFRTTRFRRSIQEIASYINERCRLFEDQPEAFVTYEGFRLPSEAEIRPWLEGLAPKPTTPLFHEKREEVAGIDEKILERLSPSSQTALLRAEGLRKKTHSELLHTEHLLAGLYMKSGGPAHQLLTIFDDDATVTARLEELLDQLGPNKNAKLKGTRAAPRSALSTLSLSAMAQEVLARAAELSARNEPAASNSAQIKSRHLLAGLLDMKGAVAGQWIANHLIVPQEKLWEAINDTSDLAPPIDLIRSLSSRERPSEEFLAKITREVEVVMQREMVTPPGGPTYFPREYIIYLSPDDDKAWHDDMRRIMEQRLLHVLSERARGVAVWEELEAESFTIEFRVDGTLKKNAIRVQPVWVETDAQGSTSIDRPQLRRPDALSRIQFLWNDLSDLFHLRVQGLVNAVGRSPALGGIGSGVLAALDRFVEEPLFHKTFELDETRIVELKDRGDEFIGMPNQVFESRPFRYVIHTCSEASAGYYTPTSVGQAITRALEKAETLELETIALTPIGTEDTSFEFVAIAPFVLDAVASHLEKGSRLKQISLAFDNEEHYRAYLAAFRQMDGPLGVKVLTPFLSTSSRHALALAEALRQHLGRNRVSTSQLLWGLYHKEGSATRELLGAIAPSEEIESAFQKRLGSPAPITDLKPVPDSALADVTLSNHCHDALLRAAQLAGDARVIRERQVVAGLLGVPDSGGTRWIVDLSGISADQLEATVEIAGEEKGQPIGPKILKMREEALLVRTQPWLLSLSEPQLVGKTAQEIRVGERITVTLDLLPALPGDEGNPNVLLIPESSSDLTGFVTATGFRLHESSRFPIQASDCRPLTRSRTFELTALLSGERTIEIELYPGRRRAGLSPSSVSRRVKVAAPVVLPDIKELIDRRQVPNPQPDVMLYVALEETPEGQRTRIYLTCFALGLDREQLKPLALSQEDLLSLRNAAIRSVVSSTHLSPQDTLAALRACGAMLFDKLFSDELREHYFNICRAASLSSTPWTWLIISDDNASVPWELFCASGVHPETGKHWHDSFLADRFVVAHWIGRRGLRLVNEAPMARVDLIHYDQRPGELPAWRSALGGDEYVEIEERAGSLSLLQPGSYCYGLHILRYAEDGRSDQIVAADDNDGEVAVVRAQADEMTHEQRLDLTLRRPTIGLSFVSSRTPADLSGFARSDTQLEANWMLPLIQAGASALVGPRWPVSVEADQVFANEFYRAMREGQSLGAAVWIARREVFAGFPHRPDWLAYAYFGHPNCETYAVREAQGFTLVEAVDHPDDAPFRTEQTYEFRASYRAEAPAWFEGRLRVQRKELASEDLSVMVLPLSGILPKIYELNPIRGSSDLQCTFSLTMPEKETTMPVMVRFQKQNEELRTVMLQLQVKERL